MNTRRPFGELKQTQPGVVWVRMRVRVWQVCVGVWGGFGGQAGSYLSHTACHNIVYMDLPLLMLLLVSG